MTIMFHINNNFINIVIFEGLKDKGKFKYYLLKFLAPFG